MEYQTSNQQYDKIVAACKEEFLAKATEYGHSLRAYDAFGVLQKIYIKLFRIKTIQDKGVIKVEGETIDKEFPGIINYCFYDICLIKHYDDPSTLYDGTDPEALYEVAKSHVKTLFEKKNHDYGEAWRELTIGFMIRECITKYLRAKTIYAVNRFKQSNQGETKDKLLEIISDICNYAIFCSILISEGSDPMI